MEDLGGDEGGEGAKEGAGDGVIVALDVGEIVGFGVEEEEIKEQGFHPKGRALIITAPLLAGVPARFGGWIGDSKKSPFMWSVSTTHLSGEEKLLPPPPSMD